MFLGKHKCRIQMKKYNSKTQVLVRAIKEARQTQEIPSLSSHSKQLQKLALGSDDLSANTCQLLESLGMAIVN